MTENITTGRLEVAHRSTGDRHEVVMDGQIDERTKLVDLADKIDAPVVIDLEKVSFINSVGVREWIRMLRSLRRRKVSVIMRRCSEAMIHQMNMIVEAKGDAQIESFFAPYVCDGCGYEGSMCLEVTQNAATLNDMRAPDVKCPECSLVMEFNEIPERYLLFLEDAS